MSRPTEATPPPALDPQLVAALRRNEDIVADLGPVGAGAAQARAHFMASRAWWNEGGPTLAIDQDDTIPLSATRSVAVARYAAQASAALRPAYVFLHGGGFRLGAPRSNDRQLRELARAWGGIVISLDYAHLPEAAFPRAVEESAEALQWLHRHGAAWGIDPARMAWGGSSAGANVAMGAAVQLGLGRSGFLQAGAFVVGVFDDDLDTPSMQLYGEGGMLPSRQSARALFEAYAGGAGQRQDPRFNAHRADLGAMPALFLAAAEHDVYRDSSLRLGDQVRQAGGSAEVKVYPGMSHLFWGYSRTVEAAQTCTHDLAAFLGRQLPVRE